VIWPSCGGNVDIESTLVKKSVDFLLITRSAARSQGHPTMGQQSNKIIKRRRRADYLKRKKEQVKNGAIVKKSVSKKEPTPAKKDLAPKKAVKKAPAKKIAKKDDESDVQETTDSTVTDAAEVQAAEAQAAEVAVDE
jgi:hypothetical protein